MYVCEILNYKLAGLTIWWYYCPQVLKLSQAAQTRSKFSAALSPSQTIATDRDNVGSNMLRAFGHPVATYWVLLAQSWNWSNISRNICGCCIMMYSVSQVHATMLRLGMRTSSIFNSLHVATRCNKVAKHVQHVAPNNVAICCVQMLRLFGRSFTLFQ